MKNQLTDYSKKFNEAFRKGNYKKAQIYMKKGLEELARGIREQRKEAEKSIARLNKIDLNIQMTVAELRRIRGK